MQTAAEAADRQPIDRRDGIQELPPEPRQACRHDKIVPVRKRKNRPQNAIGIPHQNDEVCCAWLDFGSSANLRLAPENGILLDAYRFDTLDALFELSRRVPLKVAA